MKISKLRYSALQIIHHEVAPQYTSFTLDTSDDYELTGGGGSQSMTATDWEFTLSLALYGAAGVFKCTVIPSPPAGRLHYKCEIIPAVLASPSISPLPENFQATLDAWITANASPTIGDLTTTTDATDLVEGTGIDDHYFRADYPFIPVAVAESGILLPLSAVNLSPEQDFWADAYYNSFLSTDTAQRHGHIVAPDIFLNEEKLLDAGRYDIPPLLSQVRTHIMVFEYAQGPY